MQGEAPTGGSVMRRLLLATACLAAATGVSAAIPAEVTIDTGTLAGTTGR